CLQELLGKGPSTVIITSINSLQSDDFMMCYAGVMANSGSFYMTESSIHKVPFTFKALEKTMEVMHEVLLKTIEKYTELSSCKNMHESYKKELSLINSINILKFN
ncbi:hypothetical protein MXB_562, partial [Myxobolus squamalis]